MKYLYESCVGTYYSTDEAQTYEQMDCEQCGDSDTFIGTYETEEERKQLEHDYNKY